MARSNVIQKKANLRKPPLPVDRGWAWLIMLGAFVILMLATTFIRSLSILLPYILDRYQAPATVTTLAFGVSDITWSVTNIVIPTVLLPRFNVRNLVFVGAVLHFLCIIGVAYSPNIIIFNCVFGVLGSATGIMAVPSLIYIGNFFKKRLSFANSFAHAGGSTGTVFVPLLAQKLLDNYGLHGTLLIIAGMCFNCVAASMLLRPLSMYDHVEDVKEPIGHDPIDLEFSALNNIQNQNGSLTHDECDVDEMNEKSKFLEDVNNKISQVMDVGRLNDYKIKINAVVIDSSTNNETMDNAEETTELIPKFESKLPQSDQHKKDDNELKEIPSLLFQSTASDGAVSHQTSSAVINNRNTFPSINESTIPNNEALYNSKSVESDHTCPSSSECTQSFSSDLNSQQLKPTSDIYPELFSEENHKPMQQEQNINQTDPDADKESNIKVNNANLLSGHFGSIRKMKEYIRSSVILNPVAVMLILAGGLSTGGGAMYLPVLGLENGLTPEEVPWVITIIGVADVFGKLAIGYFADLGYLRPIRIACMTQFIVGTMCQFTVFYKGFAAMATTATVYGLTAGIVHALLTPMIIEMVGLQYLGQVMSIYFLTIGMSTFILNVSVGAIRDATGSFTGGFSFLGVLMLLSLLLLLLEPVFVRCRDRKSSNSTNSVKVSSQINSSSV